MSIYIRRMNHSDENTVKKLIEKTILHKSMLKVYDACEIAMWHGTYDINSIAEIVDTSHAYLLFDDESDRLLASGYIKLSEDGHTAHIGMVFTDYEFRKQGLGKKIINTLEQDEYARQADRIELEAVLSAYRFYQKMGYVCKDNEYQIELSDGTHILPMEKFITPTGK